MERFRRKLLPSWLEVPKSAGADLWLVLDARYSSPNQYCLRKTSTSGHTVSILFQTDEPIRVEFLEPVTERAIRNPESCFFIDIVEALKVADLTLDSDDDAILHWARHCAFNLEFDETLTPDEDLILDELLVTLVSEARNRKKQER